MMKKKAFHLLFAVSLSANAMVIVTWIITKSLGYDMIHPTILFKNIVAAIVIVGVSTIFGLFYSRNTNSFIIGSLHFLIVTITFIFCGLWAHWFPLDWGIILTSLFIFTVIFLGIWICHYLYWKNQIKKINNKLA